MVAPLARSWIEMFSSATSPSPHWVAPLAGAWIEIAFGIKPYQIGDYVAPLAGAWIEIPFV